MKDYLKGLDKDTYKRVWQECVAKVEGTSDKDWQDIIDEYNLGIHRDVLRKAVTAQFGAYAVSKFIEEESQSSNKDAILKADLEKEKIRLQDQRREYKKYLRQDARFEHLIDVMREGISELKEYEPIQFNQWNGSISDHHAVLLLSDWHIGLEVDNVFNKYNFEEAQKRMANLIGQTLYNCETHGVKVIHVVLLGDMVNGYLRASNRVENEMDIITQSMKASELLSEAIHRLASGISSVHVYSGTGNHGRCTPNLKESLDVENFERLIPWYLETRLSKIENVFMEQNMIDEHILNIRFLNENIYAVHGNMDKPMSVVDNLSKMMKEFPTEVLMGHYHSYKESDDSDITVTINGSFCGSDEFSKKIRKIAQPTQTLMIYNTWGRLCTYKIKL